jgi:hypothetical protein
LNHLWLKNILRKAGFKESNGKGSHTKWSHSLLWGKIVLLVGELPTNHHPLPLSLFEAAQSSQINLFLES